MSLDTDKKQFRVLIVDDSEAIHEDFRKVLRRDDGGGELDDAERELFGETEPSSHAGPCFELDSAMQGKDALEMVKKAVEEGRPYALAFVDVRMPPGWDGIETIEHIWKCDDNIQTVICTAYSDYSWEETTKKLGYSERLLILKKPFDNIEVHQLACALTEKWAMTRQAKLRMEDLEVAVQTRTEKIQKQKNDLEEAVAKLQQAHAQLLQSDKMASIGQLAAGVAHEINNPIGFISSNLNTLSDYAKDLKEALAGYRGLLDGCIAGDSDVPKKAEAVKKANEGLDIDYIISDLGDLIAESLEGAHRVRKIVADLRDFSHVDTPDVNEEDINALMDKTINVAWNELKYKTTVDRQYGKLPAVPCYGGKLGQVFLNLLVNAAHAIEEKGTITIRTGADDTNAWIEVVDTGCGISAEHINRIFDPFFTTKDVGKGTGMGLNLAYKIIEAHGGRISVRSTVGEGTTFRIELPLSGPPAEAAAKKEAQHAGA